MQDILYTLMFLSLFSLLSGGNLTKVTKFRKSNRVMHHKEHTFPQLLHASQITAFHSFYRIKMQKKTKFPIY